MPKYLNVLVSKDFQGTFNKTVLVYIFDPLEFSGEAILYLIEKDLYADITSEIEIGDFYLDYHSTNKNIDILFLMNYDKRNKGFGRIKDQVNEFTLNKGQ